MKGLIERRDRSRAPLLGLAVGDAVGTSVEFRARGTFPPLTDMVGDAEPDDRVSLESEP